MGRGQPHGWAGQDRQPRDSAPAQTRRAGGVGREGHGALINVTVLGLLALPVCGGDARADAGGDAVVSAGMLAGMRASALPVLLRAAPLLPGSSTEPAPSPSGCPLPSPICPMTTCPCHPKWDPPAHPARLRGFTSPTTGCGPQGGSPCSAEEELQHFQVIWFLLDTSSPFPFLDIHGHVWGGLTCGVQGWDGRHSAVPWGGTGRDTDTH